MQYDTIKLGSVVVERTPGGRVSFLDRRGHRRVSYSDPFVLQLLDAVEHGSGELVPTVISEGTEPARNVVVNRAFDLQNGAPLPPSGNWIDKG